MKLLELEIRNREQPTVNGPALAKTVRVLVNPSRVVMVTSANEGSQVLLDNARQETIFAMANPSDVGKAWEEASR